MKMIPVRCCCEPHKILGLIPETEGLVMRKFVRVDKKIINVNMYALKDSDVFETEDIVTETESYDSGHQPLSYWEKMEGFKKL